MDAVGEGLGSGVGHVLLVLAAEAGEFRFYLHMSAALFGEEGK